MSKTIKTGYISATINKIKVKSSKKCSSKNYNNNSSRTVKYVVMHYTGNKKDTASANANYFMTGGREASAHFFVDNDSIYQSVELRDTAWHCGAYSYKHKTCRNANSIGIEMCCTAGNYKISSTTIKNAAYLCAYICNKIGVSSSGVDTYVLRHYDVTGKNCPAQMVSSSKEWKSFKTQVKDIIKKKYESSSTTSSTTSSSKKTYSGTYPTLPKRGYFKQGDTGTNVQRVQKYLNWAISAGLATDKIYGPKTVSAVKKFQKKYSLTQDGKFGKKTLAKAKTVKK